MQQLLRITRMRRINVDTKVLGTHVANHKTGRPPNAGAAEHRYVTIRERLHINSNNLRHHMECILPPHTETTPRITDDGNNAVTSFQGGIQLRMQRIRIGTTEQLLITGNR